MRKRDGTKAWRKSKQKRWGDGKELYFPVLEGTSNQG
jgi:hypothetical protein